MKRVKQINNIVIKLDDTKLMSYFGRISQNPNYGKYSCWHDKVCLEDGLTLAQAEEFCRATKDYVRK